MVRAAVLEEHGTTPRVADFAEPRRRTTSWSSPSARPGCTTSTCTRPPGPSTWARRRCRPSWARTASGVLEDGRRVFFDVTVSPYGSMAERALVPAGQLLEPDEGVDDAVAAALGNTGLAAYLALTWRARLRRGETVLVLGATGAVGTVAVQVARTLGAGRVVAAAAGRRPP